MNKVKRRLVMTLKELRIAIIAAADLRRRSRHLMDVVPVCSRCSVPRGKSEALVMLNDHFYCLAHAYELSKQIVSSESAFKEMLVRYRYGQDVYPIMKFMPKPASVASASGEK